MSDKNEGKKTDKLSDEEMAQVKGGPAYMKLGDIKGEVRAGEAHKKKLGDISSVDAKRR